MKLIVRIPSFDAAQFDGKFEELSATNVSSEKIRIISSLLIAIPAAWRNFQSEIAAAALQWETAKAQLIAEECRAEAEELSRLQAELSQKENEFDAYREQVVGKRSSIERTIRKGFEESWESVGTLLKPFTRRLIPEVLSTDPILLLPSATPAGTFEQFSPKKKSWFVSLLINKTTVIGVPVVMTVSAIVSCLVIAYHPEPDSAPFRVLAASTAILAGFIYLCFSTRAVLTEVARTSYLAIEDAHIAAASEIRRSNQELVAVREFFSGKIASRQKQAKLKTGLVEANDAKSYDALEAALGTGVEAVRSMHAAILNVTQDECFSVDRITSDLAETCSLSIAGKIDIEEQLRLRFGTSEYPGLPLFDDISSSVAQRLARSLPDIIYEKVFVPYLWRGERKKSLLIRDSLPAADGFSTMAQVLTTRLLRQLEPGTLKFVFFDPVGLGQTFAPILALSDYDESIISNQIWSHRDHIKRRLKDMVELIETIIQKYLRNDFEDIGLYNKSAGEIAEAYRFIFVADFPEGFDEESYKDLVRILHNGPRCGVFAVIHHHRSRKAPYGIDFTTMESLSTPIERNGSTSSFTIKEVDEATTSPQKTVWSDGPPPQALTKGIVKCFGEGVKAGKVVEVPYLRILSSTGLEWWAQSAAAGIRVPLGPSGARRIQFLELGSGTAHHVLIVGRPGSGKSNLIHVFITALSRFYSPDEISLYLVDFKKGVEFKPYADWKLPHARVIAIESEREFGFNILEGLNAELVKRGEMFRSNSTNSLVEFRNKTKQKLPRIVLIIDEFQELFSADDRLKRDAAQMLDRLVRQGRAFGIHLILATQSLANAGLDRATQDQMAVRIALQCSETDSRLILAQDNIAARLLSRPGEAIYNDAVGLVEGNKPFQVAFFSDADRETVLGAIDSKAREAGRTNDNIVIFEGHDAARLEVSRAVLDSLRSKPPAALAALTLWMGEPIALKPTLGVELKRQAAHNLLVLTRDEKEASGLIMAALISAMAGTTGEQCSFQILNFGDQSLHGDLLQQLIAVGSHDIGLYERRDLGQLFAAVAEEIDRRADGSQDNMPRALIVIFGLQRARELRNRDAYVSVLSDSGSEPDHAKRLSKILREGPEVGVHTVIWCDTFANLDRTLDRGVLRDIALRVSGPLPAADSQQLFGEPVASSIDRPHRMVSYDDEKVGMFDLFRPFAAPSRDAYTPLLQMLSKRVAQEHEVPPENAKEPNP
jgi:KaiC/GvpD/RAD55 family RecA-like ATPase